MSGDGFDPGAFNAFEAAAWEARADAYHGFFAPITTRVIPALLDLAGAGPGCRLLDVATGPGYAAAAAVARGAEVIGLDVAAEMVSVARRLHPDLEFRQGDAEQLPFGGGSFDAVTANFAVLHLGRPERAAAEMARVLAPGGVVALSAWDLPERCRLVGVLVEAVAEVGVPPPANVPPGPSFFRFSSDDQLVELLTGAGLDDVTVRTASFSQRLPSADALWDGLLEGTVRMRATVLGHPPDVQRRIRAAFDDKVAD